MIMVVMVMIMMMRSLLMKVMIVAAIKIVDGLTSMEDDDGQ